MTAALRLYALQHCAVAASAVAALFADAAPPGSTVRNGLVVLVVVAGASAGVGAAGSSVAVERRFTKLLCGPDAQALAVLNARMRAVDMACLLLAPLFAGALLQWCGFGTTVWALTAYNAAAVWPERALLRAAAAVAPAMEAAACCGDGGNTVGWREAWRVYASQPVLPAALALAALYCTVLSLGFLMTAYLHARGVPEVAVALARGGGALAGLAATAAFPRLARHAAPMPTLAAAGVAAQLLWLLLGVLPQLLAPPDAASAGPLLRLLMAGLALSRFGLWTADLAVSQVRTPLFRFRTRFSLNP